MNNLVFTLYNRLSCRYGDVMAFPTVGFALARLVPALSQNGVLEEHELCEIGFIDVDTGILTAIPPVRHPWDTKARSEVPVV